MTKTITINDASFTEEEFVAFAQRAHQILDAENEAKLDYKDFIEDVAEKTKLNKKVLSKYFKARYKDKVVEQSKEAEEFAALKEAINV